MSDMSVDGLNLPDGSDERRLLDLIAAVALQGLDKVYGALVSPWGSRGLCEGDDSFFLISHLLSDEGLYG